MYICIKEIKGYGIYYECCFLKGGIGYERL